MMTLKWTRSGFAQPMPARAGCAGSQRLCPADACPGGMRRVQLRFSMGPVDLHFGTQRSGLLRAIPG
jgi:hypothetical protein